MAKIWLITGSGNGLGRDIAEAALAAGDSVVAGARRIEELDALVAQYGERITPAKLDVRDEAAAKAAVLFRKSRRFNSDIPPSIDIERYNHPLAASVCPCLS